MGEEIEKNKNRLRLPPHSHIILRDVTRLKRREKPQSEKKKKPNESKNYEVNPMKTANL